MSRSRRSPISAPVWAPALLGALFAGCSGSSSGAVEVQAVCVGNAAFCLTACNLGCASGSCTISEVAQNQPLVLEFSKRVDPGSVNSASFSIRTASGESPIGRVTVEGNKVTFTPEIRISAGNTVFGFQAGKEYQLTLIGGAQAIRSVSGDAISRSVNCTLRVSQGIVDLDQAAPVATPIAPDTGIQGVTIGGCQVTGVDVARTASVVVRFSELIDTSPFQGASTEFSPIRYQLRKPLRNAAGELRLDAETGLPLPDPAFVPVLVQGVPRASVNAADGTTQVTLTPVIPLPSETWVEVLVTDQVRDLSGRSAEPRQFCFFTERVVLPDQEITENFERGSNLDPQFSSGAWGGFRAVGGRLGGDGRLGSFDVRSGTQLGGPDRFQWNTDNQQIPGARTLSGQPITVTDGRFFFTDFVLPRGFTLTFTGSKPPQIFVSGRVDIAGKIEANGLGPVFPWQARPQNSTAPEFGQEGGPSRLGGAGGGRGAHSGSGESAEDRFDGQNGEDVRVPAGHAYLSRVAGSGGRGSAQFPASGLNADVTFAIFGAISGMTGSGGGGGGFFQTGGSGFVARSGGSFPAPGDAGPPTPAGRRVDLFADAQGALPPGTVSLDHFSVGGSGGGGGGSHPARASISVPGGIWKAGGGGTGGGGAIAIRAGGTITIQPFGTIEARGGDGPLYSDPSQGLPQPGGGGSGGTILLQSAIPGGIVSEGTLDTSGGRGGEMAGSFFNEQTFGGNGSPGLIRVETPDRDVDLDDATTIPAVQDKHIGVLTDSDPRVHARSKWYSTRVFFPPEFLYYEVVAEIDGQLVFLSDNPATRNFRELPPEEETTPMPADDPQAPVYFLLQGADVNATTRLPVPETLGPWRRYAGTASGQAQTLNLDEATGFRFTLVFNREFAQDIVVKRVTLVFRS